MQPVGGGGMDGDQPSGGGLGQRLQAGLAYMQEAGAGYRSVGDDPDEFGDDAEAGDDRWKFMADDLDVFFRRAYSYYNERGYHCILVGEGLNMLLQGYVNYVTKVLLLWVDWASLLGCREHDGCHDITPFVTGGVRMSGSLGELVSLIFVLGTWAFWIVCLLQSLRKVKDAKQMAQFYHRELGLSETDLLSKKWDQVVDEIVDKQTTAGLTHNRHDALDIANRIMRHDNYFIAMINCAEGGAPLLPLGLGTFTVPSPIPCIPVSCRNSLNLPEALVLPTPPDFLSTTLFYTLRWALLDDMFDPATFRLREKYSGMDGAVALQNRFKLAAIASFVLSPFIVLAMTMYLVLKHAEKILRRPAYATERRWNDLAKWRCRWFNEMEHVFDMRKEKSYKHADAYVEQFTSEVLGLLARFLTFVCGSLAGLLLVICSIIMLGIFLVTKTGEDEKGRAVHYVSILQAGALLLLYTVWTTIIVLQAAGVITF
jgi:autophagy-related protein 9